MVLCVYLLRAISAENTLKSTVTPHSATRIISIESKNCTSVRSKTVEGDVRLRISSDDPRVVEMSATSPTDASA
jgi:hypothetical protein